MRDTGDPSRSVVVQRAAKAWTDQLIDISGNNKLLFYRTLKVGTLDLSPGVSAVELSELLRLRSGSSVRLSALFRDEIGRLDAAKKMRNIGAKALENSEERGIATLFLAWGMATWTATGPSKTEPRAPVFLLPLVAKRRSTAGDDFDLEIDGDTTVNPTLVHYLATQLGTVIDPDAILLAADAVDRSLGTPDAGLDALKVACSAVPGFTVDESVVIGNFSFAKMPMVKDLQVNQEALEGHDLIAALAGDAAAQGALRSEVAGVDIHQPNHIPPADEFLILPADSSQTYAINRVLTGESLVIQGPPGTGKSQTIANLIAASIARGKKVLFVAEKRAAIDAVMNRLDAAGLSDVVLDLHSNASSRKEILSAYADAMDAAGSIPEPDLSVLHQNLVTARAALVKHQDAMHRAREPWSVSLFDLQAQMLGAEEAHRVEIRLPSDVLRRLDPGALNQAEADLREYVRLREIDGAPGPGRWSGAPIATPERCGEAASWAATALDQAMQLTSIVRDVCAELGATPPDTGAGVLALVEALREADAVSDGLGPTVIADPELEPTVAILTKDGGAFARMRGPYRAAKKRALEWKRPDRDLDLDAVTQLLVRALHLHSGWVSSVGPVPVRVPAGLSTLIEATGAFHATLSAGVAAYTPEGAITESLEATTTQLRDLSASGESLHRQPRLRELESALDAIGLRALRERAIEAGLAPDAAAGMLCYVWSRSIYDLEAPADLGAFNGMLQNDRARAFQQADREHLAKTPLRVRRAVAAASVAARDRFPEQNQALSNQVRRKRGLRPVRELFREAPDVMLALKPCWTMSPLLVAQMLPGDKQYFDLVIFDEASQVTPADAVSAILRAPQLVVAGDSRQLPPTAFFATDTAGDLDEEDEDEDGNGGGPDLSLAAGFESVLDVGASLMRASYLEWHYRSRDERLIAFSNAHIYDARLTTFPGVAAGDCLRHVRCDSAGSIDQEIDTVVELVLDHARTRPSESLGVITMGIKHAERLSEAIRTAVAGAGDRAALEPFFSETREERFFVKNLERVQGDERDAIILTIGYGKSADGRMQYRFGPLNTEGGERRLNVAVTRSRSRMVAVSSFTADDMDPNKTTAKGADLLRRFIRYAATGGDDIGFGGSQPIEMNPFEIEVRDALAAKGVPLHPQYGVSGYRLDFAAAHPDQPGRMVLAIECDGAMYHSSPTARDRDRLRQEMLERLGWTFHRIWSTDWFRDPKACAEQAFAAWQAAVELCNSEASSGSRSHGASAGRGAPGFVAAAPATSDPSPTAPTRVGPKPVPGLGQPITEYSSAQLDSLVRWIQSDTLLRTRDELVEEMVAELGFRRRGARIMAAVEAAIDRTSR
jgi:very-short-patch-repair endonuclease